MTPLWTLYLEPIIRAARPARLMQIGAGDGQVSVQLLEYCRQSGCRADIIEPRPAAGLEAALAAYPDEHVYQQLLPLKGILLAEHPHLIMLDGEPNWWTVFNALNLLRRLSTERGRPFPLVLAHHTAWPYARRDAYPNPGAVEETHPFAYQGVDPDRPDLVQDGLNGQFAHATHEGGPRNGVLTAIEDFLASAPLDLEFHNLPVLHGLGVLAPAERITPELRELIDGFLSPEGLARATQAASMQAMRLAARLAETEARLERRTVALRRARKLLDRSEGRKAKA
jgi:hypothetical protein